MALSNEQNLVLELVQKYVPTKEFGIKQAFFRTKNVKAIDFLFIVDKENSSDSIAYIQSFTSILQKSCEDIDIELSIYIHEDQREAILKNIVKERNYVDAGLSKSLFAVPA